MGIECFRVQFPKGMDANEYALKTQPATKSAGRALDRRGVDGQRAAASGRAQVPVIVASHRCSEPTRSQSTAKEEIIEEPSRRSQQLKKTVTEPVRAPPQQPQRAFSLAVDAVP